MIQVNIKFLRQDKKVGGGLSEPTGATDCPRGKIYLQVFIIRQTDKQTYRQTDKVIYNLTINTMKAAKRISLF